MSEDADPGLNEVSAKYRVKCGTDVLVFLKYFF
jgi:hypothetical protein